MNPLPDTEWLYRHYDRPELFEQGPNAMWFHHKPRYLRAVLGGRLRALLRVRSSGTLLDVGCGMGDFCVLAREAGFRVAGTEVSHQAAEFGRSRCGLRIEPWGVDEIAFGGETFDILTMWHVLEHLPDPLRALRRLRGLLAEGGILAIEVPNVEDRKHNRLELPWPLNHAQSNLGHLYYYCETSLRNLLVRAGYRILAFEWADAKQPAKHWLMYQGRKLEAFVKRHLPPSQQRKLYSALRFFATPLS